MKDWYLMDKTTRPNLLGGYENDAYLDYREDSFAETLQTNIATTVDLYSSDLSECKRIRCVIQGRMGDTQLKTLERIGLFLIGTVRAGMYIYYQDRYWLITGYPDNNGTYEKATLSLCQCKIKWQNDEGKIIERWCNGTSASKYDTGRTGNQYIILTSNNFTILLPDDDDTATLDNKRVFIDRNIHNPKKVFQITRSDDILYLFGETHGGILSFIADKNELDLDHDRPDLGICDYIDPNQLSSDVPNKPSTGNITGSISGNSNLKIGIPRYYTVSFRKNGAEISLSSVSFEWKVDSDFPVSQDVTGEHNETIKLSVSDKNRIGKSFKLQIFADTKLITEKEINIIDVM